MRISISSTLLLCAAILALNGCSRTERASVTDGSGFRMLTPAPATKAYLVNNDLPFARQVLAHNKTCLQQPGCAKGE